jgi:hypothetical protein
MKHDPGHRAVQRNHGGQIAVAVQFALKAGYVAVEPVFGVRVQTRRRSVEAKTIADCARNRHAQQIQASNAPLTQPGRSRERNQTAAQGQ